MSDKILKRLMKLNKMKKTKSYVYTVIDRDIKTMLDNEDSFSRSFIQQNAGVIGQRLNKLRLELHKIMSEMIKLNKKRLISV